MLRDLIEQERCDDAIQCIHNIADRAVKLYKLSLMYRLQHMHEHEKKIIRIALAHNIKPDYFMARKAWHDLPLLHRDPNQSKLVPRPSVPVQRNNPIDMIFCFVSASGSDEPYFQFSVELLESIKATSYKDIPFKLIDCGLDDADKDYLIKRFNVEIKDPGWDVDPSLITGVKNQGTYNGWKGLTARPHMHKHFPGYDYYFWIDTDTWLQNQQSLDDFLNLAKKQEICSPIDPGNNPNGGDNFFTSTLPDSYTCEMKKQKSLFDGIFCASANFLNAYSKLSIATTNDIKRYTYGQDYLLLTCMFYKDIKNYEHVNPAHFFSVDRDFANSIFYDDQRFYNSNRDLIGFLSYNGPDKTKVFHPLKSKNDPDKTSLQSLRYRSWPDDKEHIKQLLLSSDF